METAILAAVVCLLALMVLALMIRVMWHMEQEHRANAELFRQTMEIVNRLQVHPGGTIKEFAGTIERLAEKAIGDLQTTRQHSAERAAVREIESRQVMQQQVPIPMGPTLDDEPPADGRLDPMR